MGHGYMLDFAAGWGYRLHSMAEWYCRMGSKVFRLTIQVPWLYGAKGYD